MPGGNSGGGGGTQTVSQVQQIPAWEQQFVQGNQNIASSLASTPYQPYQGQIVAPFTSQQTQGLNGVNGAAGSYQPDMNAAQGATQANMGESYGSQFNPTSVNAATWPNANVGSYMSPYVMASLAPQLQQLQQQQAQNQLNINAGATQAGAFGDARQGVATGLNNFYGDLAQNDLIGQGFNQAYNTGLNAFQNDAANNLAAQQFNEGQNLAAFGANTGQFNTERAAQLQAANQLGNIGGLQQQLGLTGASALFNAGQQMQNLNQSALNSAFQQYLNQQNWPFQMLNVLESSAANSPYSITNYTTLPATNTLAQNLGAFGALSGGLGSLLGSSSSSPKAPIGGTPL